MANAISTHQNAHMKMHETAGNRPKVGGFPDTSRFVLPRRGLKLRSVILVQLS